MHNITERDGLFTVREPAWHGLGQVLDDYPTRAEAQAIAHPWDPITEPVYRAVHYIEEVRDSLGSVRHEPATRYEEIPESKLVVRSDNAADLGVVNTTYEPVTNGEMWDIAEAIEGEAPENVQYETAGSLKGGRKVWLLLRLREPLVLSGDPDTATIPYYALQNSHDGSGSFRGQATMVRIVCDNTSRWADLDSEARGTEFTFRHTKNVRERVEEAREALRGWRENIEQWRLINEALLDIEVGPLQVEAFIERFIPMPPTNLIGSRVFHNVQDAQDTLTQILASRTCAGINHTAYGLVQAAAEYDQHFRRARSVETRFQRAYLEQSKVLSDAREIALEVAAL